MIRFGHVDASFAEQRLDAVKKRGAVVVVPFRMSSGGNSQRQFPTSPRMFLPE
jgi:hypothetical protein